MGAPMFVKFYKSIVVFSLFFVVGFFFSQQIVNQNQNLNVSENVLDNSYDLSSVAAKSAPGRIWAVSAYLPEKLDQKVYITFEGKQIKDISSTKPNIDYILDTETIVFPGLMDMHNHIKYNVLPMWRGGQAQYKNRFEWRGYNRYKQEVTGMMHGFNANGVCAAARWGELRALVGGTTSMQGGGESCNSSFGPMNVDVANELSSTSAANKTDVISPDYMGNVFVPQILPEITKFQTQLESMPPQEKLVATKKFYDTALLNLLNRSNILKWFDKFANQPRSLRLGIQLLIGEDYSTITDNSLESFNKIVPEIQKSLSSKPSVKDVPKQIASMQLWLFGDVKKVKGYLNLPADTQQLKDLALINSSTNMDYFGKAGVISVDAKIRRYLNMFEKDVRSSMFNAYNSKQVTIAHLAEGQRLDAFNKLEYPFASQMGLVQPGLVIIHGVGLDAKMMADAASKGVSLVWSPTSNLLLYGETLDVVSAKKAGINIAMGSDWGPSGTKSMLDEIKIARQYLNKIKVPTTFFSDKDIVDMATANAAKALNLQNTVGKVEKNYLANLLFVDKAILSKQANPYSALIAAGENDVSLVVVGGEPLYGDQKNIEDVARGFKDTAGPELLKKCNLQKAIRFPFSSDADKALLAQNLNLRSVANIENLLKTQLSEFKVKLETSSKSADKALALLVPNLDFLYPCEDTNYQNYMTNFISKTLDQYNSQRTQIRAQYKLKSDFNPMKQPEDIDGEDK